MVINRLITTNINHSSLSPPLDRAAGCLPSLIISITGAKRSSTIDADVVQMGCVAVDSGDILEMYSAIKWILWTLKHHK
jgi:hypothetical protein